MGEKILVQYLSVCRHPNACFCVTTAHVEFFHVNHICKKHEHIF